MSDSHTDVQSVYPPSDEFTAQANATDELYDEAKADRLAFWAKQANRLSWDTPFDEVLDWSGAPFAKWFVGGKLNVAYNCVDRHVEAGNGDRVAIRWEGEPGDSRELTYADLLAEQSSTSSNGVSQDSRLACLAQNANRSALASSYSSSVALACAVNSSDGG
jgi:acetyl-CoA synthetase